MNAMGSHDQAGAKAPDESAVRIKEKNRIDTCRLEARTVSAAAFGDPDAFAVLGDLDCARRAPHPAGGELRPILDGSIGIWRVVYGCRSRLSIGERERQGDDQAGQHRLQRNLSSLARPHRDTPVGAGFTDTPT